MSKQGEIRVARANSAYSTYGGTRKAITTLDFGQLTPFMADEVLEEDKWQFSFKTGMDIAPLAVKTFNNIFCHQSAFFVPFTQLDREFANIRAQKKTHFAQNVGKMYSLCYAELFSAILGESGLQYKKVAASQGVLAGVSFKVDSTKDRGLFDWSLTSSAILTSNGYKVDLKGMAQILPVGVNVNRKLLKHYINDNFPGADIILVFENYESQVAGAETLTYAVLPLYYTKKGQFLRKIFDGIGYKMPSIQIGYANVPASNSFSKFEFGKLTDSKISVEQGTIIRQKVSAYPLLAYLRIIADYFVMSSVQDEEPISEYLDNVYNRVSGFYQTEDEHHGTLEATGLISALLNVSLQLHSDDVTRATRNFYDFSQPFAGTGKSGIDTIQFNVSQKNDHRVVSFPASNNEITVPTDLEGRGSKETVTLYSDNSLLASAQAPSYTSNKLLEVAHRYLITSKYAGGKLAKRLRSLVGLTDPIDDAKRSIRVMENVIPIQINGSLINSNTYNGASVDDDAGTKIGVANGGGSKFFSFYNDKGYGVGICLNWLSVQTVYANRTPRFLFKCDPKLLYQGMFDGQGFQQTIGQMEINTDKADISHHYSFGAEPLYEDLRKMSIDFFSGDVLRIPGMKSYLVPRDFRNVLNATELYAETSAVRSVRQATDEFGDLWISKDGSDPVIICVDVNVLATRKIQDSTHALALPSGGENLSTLTHMS